MATGATGRRRILVAVAVVAMALAVPTIIGVKTKMRRDDLRRHGVVAQALVVGTSRGSSTDYLWVRYLDCGCPVAVPTSNARAHPAGTLIAVRYDPRHPKRVEALTDAPNPYEAVLITGIGLGLGVLIVVPLLFVAFRRTRRARALVDTQAPVARVRVEAWERAQLNQVIPYLSVYPADAPPGGAPLLTFPVTTTTLADLEPDDVFDLYRSPDDANLVALRRGELVVVPGGKAQDAEWEGSHRNQQGDLLEADRAPAAAAAGDGPVPLFRDVAEARAYRRGITRLRWLLALFLPITLVRLAPPALLVPGVLLVFAFLAALTTTLWRQSRLLDRLAARVPGPRPVGRRGHLVARRAVQRRLAAPAGVAELAEVLGTTPDDLSAGDRRAARVLYANCGLTAALFLIFIVHLATA